MAGSETPARKRWDLATAFKLIGPLLIVALLLSMDWRRLGAAVAQAGATALALTFAGYGALFGAMVLVKGWRLRSLLPGAPPGGLYLSRLVAVSGLWGMATPGRLGDITRVVYLERAGVGRAEASLAWASERVLDMASVLALSAATTGAFVLGWGVLAIVGLYLVAAAVAAWVGMAMLRRVLAVARFRAALERAAGGPLDQSRLRVKAAPFALTLAAQALTVGCFLVVAWAFCPVIGLAPLIQANSMGTALSLLPISISGLGTREASTVAILAHFTVPAERAFLTSILDGFLFPVTILSLIALAGVARDRFRKAPHGAERQPGSEAQP